MRIARVATMGTSRSNARAWLGLALLLAAVFASCMPRPPHMRATYYNAVPGETGAVEGDTWLIDPIPGDRYSVAGEDLVWREVAMIGPADDRSGRCSVDAAGRVSFVAPRTPGEWPCLLRACRETCWVSRVTLVVQPPEAETPTPE